MANSSGKNATGTNAYKSTTHTTVGHRNHDITFKKLPMYSFPKGEKRKLKDLGPGPAAYPQMVEELQNKSFKTLYPNDQAYKYSIGARRCFDNRPINPGPAAYPILDNEKAKYFNEKLPINGLNLPRKANQFSFGLARKPLKLSIQTEPALYPSIGRSILPGEEKNKFTFSGRPIPTKSKFETPGPNMYPIFKRERMNSIHPSETKLKPTMRAPHTDVFKSNSPPPNTYPRVNSNRRYNEDILRKMTTGPNAPAYTIRKKL